MVTVPQWVKQAIFYQIFPDRFRRAAAPAAPDTHLPLPSQHRFESWNSPPSLRGFKGGNLWGVAEKLDYIADLGCNALYLCPIFASTANHRYHTTDYFQVDPMLGGNAALEHLITQAHQRGIRVVLDAVLNHCSRGHFAFQNLMENGPASPYLDWFHVEQFPLNAYGEKANYQAWWGNPELPKFNTNTPEVREYLWQVAEYWLQFGIDGWRLDVPNEIDDDSFWQEFRRRVKAINPEAYIVGEIWDQASRWLQGDQFDAVMNYPAGRALLSLIGGEVLDRELAARSGLGSLEHLQSLGASHRLEEVFARYPWEVVTAQMNCATSHDTPRLITLMDGQADRARLVLQTLFTLPGAPMIYYGDEVGLAGQHDPDNRRGMPWQPNQWNTTIRDALRPLARLRLTHPALTEGQYQRLYAIDGHLAFARVHPDQTLVVTVNANAQPWQPHIPLHGIWPRGAQVRERVYHGHGQTLHGDLEAAQPLPPFGLGVWELVS